MINFKHPIFIYFFFFFTLCCKKEETKNTTNRSIDICHLSESNFNNYLNNINTCLYLIDENEISKSSQIMTDTILKYARIFVIHNDSISQIIKIENHNPCILKKVKTIYGAEFNMFNFTQNKSMRYNTECLIIDNFPSVVEFQSIFNNCNNDIVQDNSKSLYILELVSNNSVSTLYCNSINDGVFFNLISKFGVKD